MCDDLELRIKLVLGDLNVPPACQWEPRGYPDLERSSLSEMLFNSFCKSKLAPFRIVLLPAGSLGILNRIGIIKVLALDSDYPSSYFHIDGKC